MKRVTLYTDGACSGNPGVGGYGAVFNIPQKQPEMYAKALVDFCGKYKDKTVPIETVKKNYRQYTIKHISDLFKKELNDCNGEKS